MTLRARAALAAAVTAAVALGAPVGAVAQAQVSVIEDDASLLRAGDARRERTLDDMAALGADVVRVLVLWRDAPGVWPALDAVVAGARARGLDVLLTLTGPGPAAASGCVPRDGACRPDPQAYARFVAAAGARYPTVHRWSLWNEPNIPSWLRPQWTVGRDGRAALTAPRLYRALARAGAAALAQTGHGGDDVLVGETAPVTTGTSGSLARRTTAPLSFARAVLASRGVPGTGWAHHAYSAAGLRDPALPAPRAALGPAGLGVLERELSRAAARHGTARRLDVWITEAGFQTDPPDRFFGVAPAVQAAWINETDWLMARRPRVRSVAQYLVRDEPRLSSFQSGLRTVSGARKPAWDAYRAPLWIAQRPAGRIAVWGHVRPRGARLVALQRRSAGARRWTTVLRLGGRRVERRLAVATATRKSAVRWRLLWQDAAGARHASRTARAVAPQR
jgi:hypothetical protein